MTKATLLKSQFPTGVNSPPSGAKVADAKILRSGYFGFNHYTSTN